MHAAAVLSTSIYSFHLTRRGCATYLFCSFCVCCERRRVRESARSSWINLRKTRCRFCIFLSLCCCNARAAFTSMPYTVLYIIISVRAAAAAAPLSASLHGGGALFWIWSGWSDQIARARPIMLPLELLIMSRNELRHSNAFICWLFRKKARRTVLDMRVMHNKAYRKDSQLSSVKFPYSALMPITECVKKFL